VNSLFRHIWKTEKIISQTNDVRSWVKTIIESEQPKIDATLQTIEEVRKLYEQKKNPSK
jgi:hypothetical protein